MTIDKAGIYSGLPMAAYLADPCVEPSLSSSIAITMLQKSPFHAWANHARNPKRITRDDSKVADIGSVAHELLLEKSENSVCVINPEDYPGKRGGVPVGWTNDAIREARDAARAEGKTPLLLEDMDTCRAMLAAANEFIARSQIAGVFDAGEAEAVAISQEDDVWLRCRPDWLTHDKSLAVHLKTTARSAEPDSFIRGLLCSMGYDVALAFYARVIEGATGSAPSSCILVQEQAAPYACSLIGLSPGMMDIAERKVEQAIKTWRRGIHTNCWPAYPTSICYAEPRDWQLYEIEDRELRAAAERGDTLQEEYGLQP